MASFLLQDKSRQFSCEECGKIVANIWEHQKGSRCPALAAKRKLACAERAEEVWTAERVLAVLRAVNGYCGVHRHCLRALCQVSTKH